MRFLPVAGLLLLLVLGGLVAPMARAQEVEETRREPATTEPGPLALQAAAARKALGEAGLDRIEVEAAGRRLVLWRGGTGPDLLLLHGSGQQAGAWVAVVPGLVDDFTLHVVDLPGHGDSEPGEGPLPFAQVVEGLESYLLSLDKPAILVGNSMGAWLATIQAHRHPEKVTRAVLVNGGALLNIPAPGLSLTPEDREAARRVMSAIRDPSSPQLTDEVLDDIVRRAKTGPTGRLTKDMPGLLGHLLEGKLGEVIVPIDLVWGESDGLMPLAYAQRMETELPRARLTVIERCGHIPPTECPDRFLATLREVLSQPPPPPKPPRPEEPETSEQPEPDTEGRE